LSAPAESAPAPAISVVVPVRDGERTLPALLDALAAQSLDRDRFEVVVVDNASRDRTAALAREWGARVAFEPLPNRSRARNAGVAAARAEAIAFTDADCVPEPGWLEALHDGLTRQPLLAGPVRLLHGEPPNRIERLELLWRFRQREYVDELGWAATANVGVRREAFEAVGGFDPSYRGIGEDVDFGVRCGRAGYPIAWCAGAVVAHPIESTVSEIVRRGFRHGYASTQNRYRLGERYGRLHWRHPLPALRGDWALRRFGVEPAEHRELLRIARVEYGARVAGSAWALARRAR